MHLSKILLFFFVSLSMVKAQSYYQTSEGTAKFLSDAPLEIIKATSGNLRGVINKEENTFAFVVAINTFEGFNSPLQKEHFNENYLESETFPEATFVGKIIEKKVFEMEGENTIRAKGLLKIHGVEQERIIKCKVIVDEKSIQVNTFFTLFLDDHNIKIPKIVFQKISEEIQININANLLLVE